MDERFTLCIVDDDRDVRQSAILLLTVLGFDVVAYSSGCEFLADFRNHHPACVLIDQRMPGMAGSEVLSAMRDLGSDVPVILVSGQATAELRDQLADPSVQLLEKPVDMHLLESALRIALGRSARAG